MICLRGAKKRRKQKAVIQDGGGRREKERARERDRARELHAIRITSGIQTFGYVICCSVDRCSGHAHSESPFKRCLWVNGQATKQPTASCDYVLLRSRTTCLGHMQTAIIIVVGKKTALLRKGGKLRLLSLH